jgi:hypothetical protein
VGVTRKNLHLAAAIALGATSIFATFASCTDSYRGAIPGAGGGTSSATTTATVGSGGEGGLFMEGGPPQCDLTCSNDLKTVIDCMGVTKTTCTVDQGCSNGVCVDDPCKAATDSKSSYGCDYYALKTAMRPQADGACFAAFVANTWGKPVHISVDRGGVPLATETFTYLTTGQGQTVTYTPYDAVKGLDVGEVAILFLSRKKMGGSVIDCPKPAAMATETGVVGTGRGSAFHITTDVPVVAYQIDPYGGGAAAVTSATLLLPTSAWDTNYIAINAYKSAEIDGFTFGNPSLDILAYQDATEVSILPNVDIVAGMNVIAGVANTPVKYTLNKGEFLQITQPAELTGSPIVSTKPIGVFGASSCMTVPNGVNDCDSAQQQLAPVQALGNEYAAIRYRGRMGGTDEAPPWRLVGAVKGTKLTWTPMAPMGAPTTLDVGQVAEFNSTGQFVVSSQDLDHPFYLGGYMTGGEPFGGEGDPDWVNIIPPSQYLNHYVLFTDPTYPETSLTVVRTPSKVDQKFAEVTLACAGVLKGWTKVGAYEYTRVDLVTGDFMGVGGCTNGRQEMTSTLPFGVTVWGWGNTQQTKLVSYAYPAGAGFQPINKVVVPAIPQ